MTIIFPLLKALPIRFVGNMVEGRDIFSGLADVIVCDGFVGNVALKTSEGVGRFVRDVLRESLTRTVTRQVGALLSRQAFNEFRHRLDYREYGGAHLLGVRGVCIIGHGSSNDRANFNGIRVAYESAKAGTIQSIEAEFASRPRLNAPAEAPVQPEIRPFAERAAEMLQGARVDVAFTIEDDAYSAAHGGPDWSAKLRDVRPAAPAPALPAPAPQPPQAG